MKLTETMDEVMFSKPYYMHVKLAEGDYRNLKAKHCIYWKYEIKTENLKRPIRSGTKCGGRNDQTL